MTSMPAILALSEQQLKAYNAGDIEAFCACYHEEIVVLGEDGSASMKGMSSFRERYGQLFDEYEVKAWITERMLQGNHIVEKETWWRKAKASGEEFSGEVIVRYSEKDGKIGIAEFLK
jgi:hypothetical protein